jgi:hypothetical protein
LLFILVRGLADTENFDLSFPLWAITLTSLTLARSEGLHLDRPLGQAISPSQLHQQGAKQRSSLKAYSS